MEPIPYMHKTMPEHDWLNTPELVDSWHVYYKPAMHLEVFDMDEYPGDMTLSEVVEDINEHIAEDFPVNEAPCVLVSGVPIVRFYPEVRENDPAEIVFYDGGAWYWSWNCESGEYLGFL